MLGPVIQSEREDCLRVGALFALGDARLLLVALTMFFGCGLMSAAKEDTPTYRISSLPEDAVLEYGFHGGYGLTSPRYHLYGDGLLVREVIDKMTNRAVTTKELQLSLQDVDALMQMVVESGVPELTQHKIRAVVGPGSLVQDAWMVVLQLRFESYQREGKAEIAPFEPKITMETPSLVAEAFPDFREAHALVALNEALEEYFEQSGTEAVMEASQGPPGN